MYSNALKVRNATEKGKYRLSIKPNQKPKVLTVIQNCIVKIRFTNKKKEEEGQRNLCLLVRYLPTIYLRKVKYKKKREQKTIQRNVGL